MPIPVKITFRDVPPSAAVEARVRRKAEGLAKFYDRIQRCQVVVEAHHRHQSKGRLYHLRIDLGTTAGEIVVNRDPREARAHQDVYVAVRDAFAAARRRLEDEVRRMRGKVKRHESTPVGRVARLFADDGYGFLETPDGLDVYFHRNAVVKDAFDRLRPGSAVRFILQDRESDKGPQASTVEPIGRRRRLDAA